MGDSSISEIDQHILEKEICRILYRIVDTKNLRNNYHVKDINILEELTIISKGGYIDLERTANISNHHHTSMRI